MRVLVVDQDSASNEAIARSLRELFTVDAVTNKGDCLDLLRSNTFEVIVATERLEDGSGLELLGQVAKKWPAMLRIFAADRQRLQLLKGRLGPFELFQALTYPIDPDRLIATLSLAEAAQEAHADTSNIQHVVLSGDMPQEVVDEFEQAEESAESKDFPAPQPAPRVAPMEQATSRAGHGVAHAPAHRGRSAPAQRPRTNGAAGRPSTRTSTLARSAAPSPPPPSEAGRPSRPGRLRSANNRAPPVRFPPLERVPPLEPLSAPASRSGGLQSDSFAEAAAMARAARSNFESPAEEFDTKRLAVMVGGGAAVVLAVVVIGFKMFGSKAEAPPVAPAVVQAPQYPPEVTDLIAQTEAALKADDFKGATADVDKLRQIAPSHPRLAFFEGLLVQHAEGSKSGPNSSKGNSGAGRGVAKNGVKSGTGGASGMSGATSAASGSRMSGTAGASGASSAASGGSASRSQGATVSGAASEAGVSSTASAASATRTSGTAGSSSATGVAGASSTTTAATGLRASGTAVGAADESQGTQSTPGFAPETPPGFSRSAAASAGAAPRGDTSGSTSRAGPTGASVTAAGIARAPGAATSATVVTTAPSGGPASAAGSTSAATRAAADEATASSGTASTAAPSQAPASSQTTATRRTSSGEPPPVVQEAKLIRRVVPDYPSAAKRDGISGFVDLEVTVSSRGVVEGVNVVRATPPDMFEKSALAAVRKWKYDPRFVDGLPSEAHLKVHLEFAPDK